MSKSLSATYYKENKERLQKKLVKDLSKEEKESYKNLSEDEKN